MEQGGYYDAIKARRGTPLPLRIFDCRGRLCLVAMTIAPKFDDALFLVTVNEDNRVSRMTPVTPYGAAIDKAAFIGSPPRTGIVITSRTHMGTPARQLFELCGDTVGRQVAMITGAGKAEAVEGDAAALTRATRELRTLRRPIGF
ncbi:hypothetical protein [Sphingomonas yabuuchiae]|nr:hypothetical protein [Sphingomonas yabuuchiae]